jgi:hypothetical protein
MKKQITIMLALMVFAFTQIINAQSQEIKLFKEKDFKTKTPEKSNRVPKAPLIAHNWTGTVSSDWFTAGNWDTGTVPTATDNVWIPAGAPFSPVIGSGSAYCDDFYLQTGASLTQNSGGKLYCYGTFDAGFGQFTMNGTSYLYFCGNTDELWWDDNQNDTYTNVRVLKSSTTAKMTMQQDMTCSGTFQIREGVFTFDSPSAIYLSVTNTGQYAFEVQDGGKLNLTQQIGRLEIDGGIAFRDGSQLEVHMNAGIILEGNLLIESNSLYDIGFSYGLLQMSGTNTQYIHNFDGGNLELYVFTVHKDAGTCYMANSDLNASRINIIKGTLSCRSAPGSATNWDIYVRNSWNNDVGDSGFDEASGRVVFNGDNAQYIDDSEVFNVLEIDKPLSYNLEINNGADVVCSAYDWTSGAIEVLSGGSFTANDLLDNAVQGEFYLNSGGTINLTNSGTGTFVDLKGDLHISGGTMNITGSFSYWPYQEDASIEMSGGVLDLTSCGIRIDDNAYSLTSNITGGTIRTAGGFEGNRSDFAPTGGTFEFYGSSNVNISQSNGCTLYNVTIDKAAKNSNQLIGGIIAPDGRIDKTIGEGKTNMAFLASDFTITNDFDIASNGFSMSSYVLDVAHAIDVHGAFHMNNVMNVLTMGQTAPDRMTFYSGSTGDFTAGTINMYGGIDTDAGCSFTATTDNTIIFQGSNAVGLENKEPTTVFGNMEVMKNPGTKMFISNVSSELIVVNGDFTLHPNCGFETQNGDMIVHGTFTDDATSEIFIYDTDTKGDGGKGTGSLEIDADFTLNGLLDVGVDGIVLLHGDFQTASSSVLTISGGSLIADKPYYMKNPDGNKAYQYLNGTLNLTNGLFEISYNSMLFSSTSVNNISGGFIRTGRAFNVDGPGLFQPSGGSVEMFGVENSLLYCQQSDGNFLHDLIIDRGGNVFMYSDVEVKHDIFINSGPLLTYEYDPYVQHDIYIGGNWTNTGGDAAFDESAGKVVFFGPNPSDITTDETFYDLEIDKTYTVFEGVELNSSITVNVSNDLEITDGTLEMNTNSTLDVDRNVHITNGAGLNAYMDTGLSLFVGGNWTDYNTSYNSVKGYTPGTELITFDGTIDQEITTNASKEDFGNLIIDKPSAEFRPNDNIYVIHDFTLQNGDWADNVGGLSHSFEENFTVNSGGYFSNEINKNTVNFVSDKDAVVHFASPGVGTGIFNVVNIDKSALKAFAPEGGEKAAEGNSNQKDNPKSQGLVLSSNVFCGYDAGVSVQNANLDLNGFTFTSTGDMDINSGGVVNVSAGSTLKIDQDNVLDINNGGTLNIIGTSGNPATLTHYNPDYFTFNVNSGGTLSAEHATFDYINFWGVNVKFGATIDPVHAFNYSTFQNIEPNDYGSDISFYNEQTLTCTGVNFPDNPGYNVWKSNNAGDVTFNAATGDFAGPEYEYDTYDHIFWGDMDVELDLNAMLEGPFNGTDMDISLNTLGVIPLNQPYDTNPAAEWYYTGTESVGSVPANVVDWVLVQLRDANNAADATGSSVVAEQAAFLLNDGSVVDLDGTSNIVFGGMGYSEGLFPVVFHRNHLGIISSVKMVRTSGVYAYDLTLPGSIYGGINGSKELAPGLWGMVAADGNGSGIIATDDETVVWKNDLGNSGYLAGDFDMNGIVQSTDETNYWKINLNVGGQVPGKSGSSYRSQVPK